MATLITRAGNAAALSANQHDENLKRETNPQSGNYTVVADDNRATVEYTGTGSHTITLPDVSTLLAGEDTGDFQVTIKNNGTGKVTVAPAALNTLDGVDEDYVLLVDESVTLKAGSVADDWMVVSMYRNPVVGAYLYTNATQSIATATWTGLNHNTVVYEHVECVASSGSPARTVITVPAGYSWMRVTSSAMFDSNATGARAMRLVTGAEAELTPPVQASMGAATDATAVVVNLDSGWISVTPADTYNVQVWHNRGSALDVRANYTRTTVEFQ